MHKIRNRISIITKGGLSLRFWRIKPLFCNQTISYNCYMIANFIVLRPAICHCIYKKRTPQSPFSFCFDGCILLLLGDTNKVYFRIPEGFVTTLVFKLAEEIVHFFELLLVGKIVWVLVAKVFDVVSAI